MSERARAFVEEWVSDHVTADDAEGDVEARAKALASQCLADAGKEGIPASEIGEVIDDLPEFLIGAIEEAEEHAERFETDKEAAELVDPQAIEDAEEDALEDEDDDDDDDDEEQ
jgi:hypothetical protein